MKPLKSKSKEAKKQRKNSIIIGILLIVVMFGSVFGVIVGSFGKERENNKIVYNGFEFLNTGNYWYLNLGNYDFMFKYNPEQFPEFKIEEIKEKLKTAENYARKPLYISSKNIDASYEIARNLQSIVLRMQNACLNKSDCEGNLPIKTCEDNFIIIEESEFPEIVQENNCVFIRAPQEKLVQMSDEFLFQILEIR